MEEQGVCSCHFHTRVDFLDLKTFSNSSSPGAQGTEDRCLSAALDVSLHPSGFSLLIKKKREFSSV
jgi:hypothetical protein